MFHEMLMNGFLGYGGTYETWLWLWLPGLGSSLVPSTSHTLSESSFSNLLAFAEVLLKFHGQSPSLCRLAALSLWHSQAQLLLFLTLLNRRNRKAAPGDRHLMAKKRE